MVNFAQFLAVCRRSKLGDMDTRRFCREFYSCLISDMLSLYNRYERGRAEMISFQGAHFPQDIILMGCVGTWRIR